MVEIDPKVRLIVEMALSVLPSELGCDDCFAFLAAYAEHALNGAEIPKSLESAGDHLRRCTGCMEELDYLLAAMKTQRSSTG